MKADITLDPEDVELAVSEYIRRKYGMAYQITVRGAPQLHVEIDLERSNKPVGASLRDITGLGGVGPRHGE